MADATIGYNRRMILDQAMQEHQQVQQKSTRTKKRIETTELQHIFPGRASRELELCLLSST
jgi:hypothetical protein